MRALVIEDEAAIQMLMVDYLVDAGIEVLDTASRIDDAMHKAATLDFDVAILDVNLIGHPSYPVAAVLKSRNIPFVFATGYGRAGLPAELEDMALLRKPFTQERNCSLPFSGGPLDTATAELIHGEVWIIVPCCPFPAMV